MDQGASGEVIVCLLAFYGSWRFITVFTSTSHCILFWARWILPMSSHHISWISTLILSFHLCLCLQNGLFTLGFVTEILSEFLISLICATYLLHISYFFSNPNQLGEVCKLWSSSLQWNVYDVKCFCYYTSQLCAKLLD